MVAYGVENAVTAALGRCMIVLRKTWVHDR